jgi:glycogen debranching enzyme
LSRAYVRREVVIWNDNLKLNYGPKPERFSRIIKKKLDEELGDDEANEDEEEELPWLWDHMRKYTEWCAERFHGVRLDNAHSTPLFVSEYLVDCARRVNSNLFIFAELFTYSQDTVVDYCSRLGITAILKEAINRNSVDELGLLLFV